MYTNGTIMVGDNDPYTDSDGTQYPWNFPKDQITELVKVQDPVVTTVEPPVSIEEQLLEYLARSKQSKNLQINRWRAEANQTYFTYQGKRIACDSLSRGDIDAVASNIALTGNFPTGFPNAWKAIDNTYIPITSIDDFKSMFAAMTLQGTVNFARAQTLKQALENANTLDEINSIVWEVS